MSSSATKRIQHHLNAINNNINIDNDFLNRSSPSFKSNELKGMKENEEKSIEISQCSEKENDNSSVDAPKFPFHLAIPVHDLKLAREFYGGKLGLEEGRSANHWIDYNLYGHQLVVHLVTSDYRAPDLYNPVDRDYVPVPHFGCALSIPEFHNLVERVRKIGDIKFLVEPHIRFPGQPGEQWTCFFKDPSGNSLEFKAMSNPKNLFARYVVKD